MPEDTTIENHKSKIANSRAGFTIAELLLALALAGMLLAAVAVAINASATNYQQNEDIFKAVNSARQALFRMTSQLRTAIAVDPNAPINECTMLTSANENITYRYNSADSKLYLITNDDLSDSDYVLCDNVTAMTCAKTIELIDTVIIVKSVQISITVESEDVEKTISAAATIRRNLY
ncbi:MAG: prepilin-type N-terminal cleavage/methylation domain-containing protein [Planctomycetota bacterium]|jgi:prepilin-type N-terminal cleavage/methylation domain-containing protein